uniref:Cytochrome P450 monooxygenase phqM n=1 Tax=Penicillium fellutanum TaxID=70095 RepID=PHQM_PENFE|nr:RecName: Full=Cytochrome P450 monooxygenase phqM; AltName: Full=Paraherquamide biosynthesis cluster protein M [Penicillium fellutanum]AGA37280.1 P450 monooxygenase [Penicillium fellutanum]
MKQGTTGMYCEVGPCTNAKDAHSPCLRPPGYAKPPTVRVCRTRGHNLPLSKVPGPKLAALTKWYGFYHNVIRDGQYSLSFSSLHKKYDSPVIRIGPNAVHVDDPSFYQEMFSMTTKYYKEPEFYKALGAEGAMASILDPKHHRMYRNHLRPLFASRAVDGVVPRLKLELEKATRIFDMHRKDYHPLNIQALYRSFTSDMVCELLFGESPDFIGDGNGYHPFVAALDRFTAFSWLVVYFPWVKSIQFHLPFGLGDKLAPEFNDFKRQCETWEAKAQLKRESGVQVGQKNLFDYYAELGAGPETAVSGVAQPVEDAFNFLTAGTESTAYTLSSTAFHILNNPQVFKKLHEELDASVDFIRNDFNAKQIQALPYLGAVLKETMRLSTAVPGNLPRLVPPGGVTVGSVYLPEGTYPQQTIVSSSHLSIITNDTIFHDPYKFKPERWLGEEGKDLERWHVGFSRGPRRCIGSSLAYLELFCVTAYVFSRFEMSLFETDESSMQWVDRISARNRKDVQVRILSDRWEKEAHSIAGGTLLKEE